MLLTRASIVALSLLVASCAHPITPDASRAHIQLYLAATGLDASALHVTLADLRLLPAADNHPTTELLWRSESDDEVISLTANPLLIADADIPPDSYSGLRLTIALVSQDDGEATPRSGTVLGYEQIVRLPCFKVTGEGDRVELHLDLDASRLEHAAGDALRPSTMLLNGRSVLFPDGSPRKVAERVLLISIDGLRPDAVTALGEDGAPALHRLRREGATTDNARTDYDFSVTLPNHVSQLTARTVAGSSGHGWTTNKTPDTGQTLHSNKGSYVASAFDVAHDAGLRTGLFASKSKFVLFETSYDDDHGAPGMNDSAREKIDVFVYDPDIRALTSAFMAQMASERLEFAFLHLRDPDRAGHVHGWDLATESHYLASIRRVDSLLANVLDFLADDPIMRESTTLILTSDHGGSGTGHSDASQPTNYTIPFYTWGAGAQPGADLYEINRASRLDPGVERPGYEGMQPIRNGDAGNLALDLLGLSDIPGGTINTDAESLRLAHRPAHVCPL